MYRTIYLSAGTRIFSNEELDALLAVSRRNNTRDGITGLLMYHDGSFLQVLEGVKDQVETCYNRINTDARHKLLVLMFRGDVEHRLFPDWSMGFARPSDLDPETGSGVKALDQVIDELPRLREIDRKAATLIRSFFVCHPDYSARLKG